jgi:hypothetical protein
MADTRALDVEELCLEDLQPLQGHRFRISETDCGAGDDETELELVEVIDRQRTRPMDGKQCFSAVFRSVAGPERPSGTYRAKHERFEIPMLYLSRIRYSLDPKDRNAYYEMIFN